MVGGGDSALQEALTLANYAASVLIFTQEESFDAQFSYVQRALSQPKIEARHRTAIEAVLGDGAVSGVRVRDLESNESLQIDLAGLFVYVGMKPNTAFLKDLVHLSNSGHVPTDGWMRTEREGLYAAGDIRQDSAAQAITCTGDGATAAIAAYRYIKNAFPK